MRKPYIFRQAFCFQSARKTHIYTKFRYNPAKILISPIKMNPKILLSAVFAGLLSAQPALALTNYICQVDGKAVYATEKLNNTCQVSQMDGISEETVSVQQTSSASLAEITGRSGPETVVLGAQAELYGEPSFNFTGSGAASDAGAQANDQISRIWEKEQYGSYDDVKILPRADVAKPAELDVKIRGQAGKTGRGGKDNVSRSVKANTRFPANYVPAPTAPPKPKLTRKQILQREIASEQAALVRAQAQLARAKKSGGNTGALEQTVRDRQANVRAIQSELKRQ